MWSARRILKELTDAEKRREVLTQFWKFGETHARLTAQLHLAKALNFRDETLRKMPAEKKAELLASRVGIAEFDQFFEMALLQYHTRQKAALMAAFLDRWNIPHENGSIDSDDYEPPTVEQVRTAVAELEGEYDRGAIRLYLATAGLLMDGQWRESTWTVVDEMP